MSDPPDLAQALLDPTLYPDSPDKIELLQTTTSYIFLTDEHAYKVKKPVSPGYLDYTTLDKRKFYCNREITLNRRLCPDVYLDTVSIIEDKKGLAIDSRGKAIEYAVKMKRMPGDAMLDILIDAGTVPPNAMERIARTISEFHASAGSGRSIADYGDPEFILIGVEKNFMDTIRFLSLTIPQKSYRVLKERLTGFIDSHTELFERRVIEGHIKDCHGNIRADHVCINESIYIFDCIEFNDSLRYGDTISDLARLAVDLDFRNRNDLSRDLVREYIAVSGDTGASEVIDFYKTCRAYDAGRWESLKLDAANLTEEQKASIISVASRYFELAESYLEIM